MADFDRLRSLSLPGSVDAVGPLNIFADGHETQRHVAENFEGKNRAHRSQAGLTKTARIESAVRSRGGFDQRNDFRQR